MTHGAHVADARTQCGGGGGDSGQAHGAGHRGAAPEPAQAAQGPQMGVLRVLLLQPGLVSRFPARLSLLSPVWTSESFVLFYLLSPVWTRELFHTFCVCSLQPWLVSRFMLFCLLSPPSTHELFRALLSAVSSLDS